MLPPVIDLSMSLKGFCSISTHIMQVQLEKLSVFAATLIGAFIGCAFAFAMYLALPPVRMFYDWQWQFMTTHPISFVICGAIGIAVGYFFDKD